MKPALQNVLKKYQHTFHKVIDFNPSTQKMVELDFTSKNDSLTVSIIENTDLFCSYINDTLRISNADFGFGGYDELRTVYSRSRLFDPERPGDEPRTLHLGTDIWAKAGTPIYAFMGGMVHSFAFNDSFGDYGATLVLLHQLDSLDFYTLYGHISLKDIQSLNEGQYITRGECIAHMGEPNENGHWPPHLHFQIIHDMELKEGDYPGVCRLSQREKYLSNCPDPELILQFNKVAS
jgi:peptidoglycan LD-endopeptidase LytH